MLESSLLTFVFKVSCLLGFSGILIDSFIESGSGIGSVIGSVIGLISCSYSGAFDSGQPIYEKKLRTH